MRLYYPVWFRLGRLRHSGNYRGARGEYAASLRLALEFGDTRNAAAVLGQLGTLAELENNLDEAERRHREALEAFRAMGEPSMEATACSS
jgi:hypothetical protein